MSAAPARPQAAPPGTPLTRPMDDATARRASLVALGAAAGTVFTVIHYTPLRFVAMPVQVVVILLVAAALTAAGAWLRRTLLVLTVGAVLVILGLVRLATYGHGSGLIGGQSSTAALLTGLGIALVGIGLAPRP
jgi:hypothetical protein